MSTPSVSGIERALPRPSDARKRDRKEEETMKTNDPLLRPEPTRPTLRIVRDLPVDARQITGGKELPKLLESAIKGQVFKKVEIHGTAT